jgi:hypothetical protein
MTSTQAFTATPPSNLIIVNDTNRVRCIHAHQDPNTGMKSNACCEPCRQGHAQVVGNSQGQWFWLNEQELASIMPFMFSVERQTELLGTFENAEHVRNTLAVRMGNA